MKQNHLRPMGKKKIGNSKLYKIKVLHGAPKDSYESIETYIIAENDEEVYNWLKKKAYWDYYENRPNLNCDL